MIKFIGYIYYWKLQLLNNAKVCRWHAVRSGFFSGYSGFLHQWNWLPRYIAEILLKVDLNIITLSYPTLYNAMIIKKLCSTPSVKGQFFLSCVCPLVVLLQKILKYLTLSAPNEGYSRNTPWAWQWCDDKSKQKQHIFKNMFF